jgi:hypothetical protein
MNTSKPKVIKDFDKLSEEMQEKMTELYPNGFTESIIRFTDKDGKYFSAVPFETEDRYYLIRLSSLNYVRPKIKDDSDDVEEKEDAEDGNGDKYTDLDTMRVGGSRRNDDDEDYD